MCVCVWFFYLLLLHNISSSTNAKAELFNWFMNLRGCDKVNLCEQTIRPCK